MGDYLAVTLPPTFYWDHVDRELPGGKITKETKTGVTILVSLEDLMEIRSDAAYYSTEWVHMGREYLGLGRSAAATVKRIDLVLEEER